MGVRGEFTLCMRTFVLSSSSGPRVTYLTAGILAMFESVIVSPAFALATTTCARRKAGNERPEQMTGGLGRGGRMPLLQDKHSILNTGNNTLRSKEPIGSHAHSHGSRTSRTSRTNSSVLPSVLQGLKSLLSPSVWAGRRALCLCLTLSFSESTSFHGMETSSSFPPHRSPERSNP